MLTNWNKGKIMGETEAKDIAVLAQRVQDHDERLEKIEKGLEALQELKINVALLVSKFANFQPNGCAMHQLTMDNFKERLTEIEKKSDSMHKKIITWTAIASVILFILSQILIPYALQNYKVQNVSVSHTAKP
jgi:hypothetical protein